jgi:DNA-binding beta-propeller fold protein YncE
MMRFHGAIFICLTAAVAALGQTGYKISSKIAVPGEGGWDYITFDAAGGRLFVAHATKVDVLDAKAGKAIGEIPKTPGVHGVALVQEAGKGYISAGEANIIVEFDLKTLKVVGHIQSGTKPDAIVYDEGSRRVLVSNGDSDDMTVIDPFLGRSVGPIALGGAPEYIVGDGKGTVWVNLEDKNETLMVDPKSMAVKKRFKLAGCEEPASLDMDRSSRRLFIGCGNKKLTVLDADSGKVVAQLPIGDHVDATIFDAGRKLAFASTGDGKISVVHEDSADKFTLVETIATQRGAKTMAYDAASGRIFLPTVEGVPSTATGPPNAKRGMYKPGPFVVLVVGK